MLRNALAATILSSLPHTHLTELGEKFRGWVKEATVHDVKFEILCAVNEMIVRELQSRGGH